MYVENGILKKVRNLDSIKGKIILSRNIKVIDSKAFYECKGLTEIVIPKNVKVIGKYAFCGCENLEKVTIEDGVEIIGERAFKQCLNLNSIEIPKSVVNIDASAFEHCGLKKLVLNEGLISIGSYAFSHTKISQINIPNTVKNIGRGCFFNCDMLKDVVLSNNVSVISTHTFEACRALKSIDLSKITLIDQRAFFECESLKKVVLGEDLKSIKDNAFYRCAAIKKIIFPNNLEYIGNGAFSTTSLKKVIIPSSVKEIGSSAFIHTNISKVVLNEGLEEIGYQAFYDLPINKIIIPNSVKKIGEGAFANCEALTKVKLSDNLETIERECFEQCFNLSSVDFGNGVKYIETYAFYKCNALREIRLPKSLKVISERAFESCGSLKKIKIYDMTVVENHSFPCNTYENENVEFICAETGEVQYISLRENGFYNSERGLVLEDKYGNVVFYDYQNNFVRFDKAYIRENEYTNKYPICDYRKLNEWIKQKKFVPFYYVVRNTPIENIKNFYINGNDLKWQKIQKNSGESLYTDIEGLYKLCYSLGMFDKSGKVSDRAFDFINDVIFEDDDLDFHVLFGDMNVFKYGYNKEFAELVFKNFASEGYFRVKGQAYFSAIYNNFEEIKKAYPNKKVKTNRRVDELTPSLCLKVAIGKSYENVDIGNEEFAYNIGIYGYSQSVFEQAQRLFNIGKSIEEEEIQLFIKEDNSDALITYELLDKDNPLGVILGDITNCCQTLTGVASSCVEYGLSKRNSKFMVFKMNNKIIGQSWVWYDEITNRICLDNIEVPRNVIRTSLKDKEVKRAFINCLKRSINGFLSAMEERNLRVDSITTGVGYNDIKNLLCNYPVLHNQPNLSNYEGYSDASDQFVLFSR